MVLRLLSLLGLNAHAGALVRLPDVSNLVPSLGAGPGGIGLDPNNHMVEMANIFNGTVATFRDPKAVLALERFHTRQAELYHNVTGRVVLRVEQLEEEQRNGGGPQLLARALLDFEREMRVWGEVAPQIVEEVSAALPPNSVVQPIEQLDSRPMMGVLNTTFNNKTLIALEQDAAGNGSSPAERCDHMRPVVTELRKVMTDIDRISRDQDKAVGLEVYAVETSAVVMIAPDIMPKFKDFTLETNRNLVTMTRLFAQCIGNLTDFVMTGAERDLGCSVLKSHARPQQHLGFGLLTSLVLATAVALGLAF